MDQELQVLQKRGLSPEDGEGFIQVDFRAGQSPEPEIQGQQKKQPWNHTLESWIFQEAYGIGIDVGQGLKANWSGTKVRKYRDLRIR